MLDLELSIARLEIIDSSHLTRAVGIARTAPLHVAVRVLSRHLDELLGGVQTVGGAAASGVLRGSHHSRDTDLRLGERLVPADVQHR